MRVCSSTRVRSSYDLRRTEKGGTSSASSAIGKPTDVWDSSLCSLAPENVNSGDVRRCGSTFFQYFVHHV